MVYSVLSCVAASFFWRTLGGHYSFNKQEHRITLSSKLDKSQANVTAERTLVEQATAGSDLAFKQLIQRYQQIMLHVARAIIGNVHAEDVVQESWTSAYRALPKFEFKASFKTWILTIVSNEAKSRLRKESRQVSLEQMESDHPYMLNSTFKANGHWQEGPVRWHTESPDTLLEEKQLEQCIKHTLSLLPEQQKAAFMLRVLERHPFTDICNLLDISAANARVLIHRARLTLMQVIDRYQETGEC